ncbi:MAG: PilN domain-containing protein [bacterium]
MKSSTIIEISKSWIKIIAQERKKGQGGHLIVLSQLDFAESQQSKSLKLKQLITQHNISTDSVIISIPRDLAIVREQKLPTQNPDELKKMVELNIVHQTVYKKDDILTGYLIGQKTHDGYTYVLFSIINKQEIVNLHSLIQQAGIYSEEMILSSFGVLRVFNLFHNEVNPNNVPILLMDLGVEGIELLFIENRQIVASTNISNYNGSDLLTGKESIDGIVEKINQVLFISSFSQDSIAIKPTKMIITGAKIIHKLEINELQTKLNLPIDTVDLTARLELNSVQPSIYLLSDQENQQSNPLPQISLSSLLGFRFGHYSPCISFLLPELEIRNTIKKQAKALIFCGILIIYITTIFSGFFWLKIDRIKKYQSNLNNYLKEKEEKIVDLTKKKELNNTIEKYLQEKNSPYQILYEIQNRVSDENTVIESLEIRSDKNKERSVILKGTASSLGNVFDFCNRLKEYSEFSKANTKSTDKRQNKGQEIVSFEINL